MNKTIQQIEQLVDDLYPITEEDVSKYTTNNVSTLEDRDGVEIRIERDWVKPPKLTNEIIEELQRFFGECTITSHLETSPGIGYGPIYRLYIEVEE